MLHNSESWFPPGNKTDGCTQAGKPEERIVKCVCVCKDRLLKPVCNDECALGCISASYDIKEKNVFVIISTFWTQPEHYSLPGLLSRLLTLSPEKY